ncbi:MAG TPA: hypothetical protein DEQ68_03480 [Ruminococcaceae bacterium]|nr:hypothetical protein [Oscillospiraceae bacterium]
MDASLNGTLPFYTSLKVCDTPKILLDIGCEQLPMLYTQKHLRNAVKPTDEKNHQHGLEVEQIKKLPNLLSGPVMVFDSPNRKDSVIVVTSEVDKENNPIIASIKPNGSGRYEIEEISSNFITSVYGRNNFPEYFKKIVQTDSLLFCDKKKSQEMFERWGEQYSELTNTLDFNIIIHQSWNIVKGFEEKISEDRQNFEQITLDSAPERATYSTIPAEFDEFPTITCDWSESEVFEDGKTYSVLEFDELMKRADSDWMAARKKERDSYGEAYEAIKNGEIFGNHQGYAKTKFTVNLPNGDKITERQDIGDGYGGVIDFLSQYGKYNAVSDLLRATAEIEKIRAAKKNLLSETDLEMLNSIEPRSATFSTIPAEPQEKHDFRITEDTELGAGGAKTKFAANIAAIRTLKAIESENRLASPDEQQILAKYVGWGGLSQAFDSGNGAWTNEYKQLRALLTDDEYKAAAESTLNAHYTSPEVIGAMYKALDNFGFESGNVLEPSMGVGNFFGCLPEKMRGSKLYGVELDDITGRIAKQLYQTADIQINGFEKTDFPDNFFDAAIGNVPFGNYGVSDARYNKENFLVHDYFFAKTLDKVAPGGVVAFITSKGTLDKVNPKVREYLAKRADLIGAIRLPNNAFKGANTEVTSDIIFLQKREKMAVELPDWCYTAKNSDGITVNQYFIDNPEMVLGKLELASGQFGQEVTCSPIESEKLSEQLDRAVSRLRERRGHKRP